MSDDQENNGEAKERENDTPQRRIGKENTLFVPDLLEGTRRISRTRKSLSSFSFRLSSCSSGRNSVDAMLERTDKGISGELLESCLATRNQCWNSRRILKEMGNCVPLTRAMKFFVHFVVVMLVLYCGAIVFAVLEEPGNIFLDQSDAVVLSTNHSDEQNKCNQSFDEVAAFWNSMEEKYHMRMEELPGGFMTDVESFFAARIGQESEGKDVNLTQQYIHTSKDRYFIFMKWFYFVTIATTTIGYGHIYPKTYNGKLFYIIFSIIGITLMMTLLKSCGALLASANKKVYSSVFRKLFRKKNVLSEELMSVFSITVMFVIFMFLVFWHDERIEEIEGWSRIDTVYFWIVTFTTVGFGDVHFSLEVEIEHVYEMLFYRVFGLSFLAGIIDSMQKYLKYRKKELSKKSSGKLVQLKRKLIGAGLIGGFGGMLDVYNVPKNI